MKYLFFIFIFLLDTICSTTLGATDLDDSVFPKYRSSPANLVKKQEIIEKKVIYKQNVDSSLQLITLQLEDNPGLKPTIVFFFGGAWKTGSPYQFYEQASYLAKKGMLSILVEYRTEETPGVTPFNSLEDAKSAMRFIKKESQSLGVDTTRLVTSGGSAGGHLAAACAYVTLFNDPEDNLRVSTRPTAMILFNPIIDISKQGCAYPRIKERSFDFSPIDNIYHNAIPTLFMVGDHDRFIPVSTAKLFKKITEEHGAKCTLKIFKGEEHGFFNFGVKENKCFYQTMKLAEDFLRKLRYIE